MPSKKKSLKTKQRYCPKCGKTFRSMTDNQWEVALLIHLSTSKKHHRYKGGGYEKLPLRWKNLP